MTSLAAQLHNLQTMQTDLYDLQRKAVSVLVPAAEAKHISRDAYYKIGQDGFKELQELPGFIQFSDFFSESSRTVQRAMLSAQQNERLDKQIESFLMHLGPYLERTAALKCLEWLVQRYMVNEMNIDSFMSCILPFFETQLFIRLLQVVNLDRSRTWHWLKPSQKAGRPLPRSNLFNHWCSTEWFRNFIANTFIRQMETLSPEKLQYSAAFFILTVEGGLNNLNKITETHLTTVYRTMKSCLSSKSPAARGGMAFLLLSLSAMTTFTESFAFQIVESLCKSDATEPMGKETLMCIVGIVHSQRMETLPHSVINLILKNKVFFKELVRMSETKNISKFMLAVASSSVSFLFGGSIAEEDIPRKFNKIVCLLEEVNIPDDAMAILKIFLTSVHGKMAEFKSFESCPNFWKLFEELNISPAELVSHEDVKVSTNSKQKKVNNTNSNIEDIVDEKSEMVSKKKKERAEIKEILNKIKQNVLLKSPDFHLLREEEYNEDFQDIVNILQVSIRKSENDCASMNPAIINELFMTKTLKTFNKKIYFLSMIWCSSPDSAKNLDSDLKKWALLTANDMIKNCTHDSISWMANSTETFIASLFLPICDKALSSLTFNLIENLVEKMGPQNGHKKSKSFLPLLRELLTYKMEITDDDKFLPRAMETICTGDKKFLTLLKNIIADEDVPMRIKSSLLYSISNLTSFQTLISLVPLANKILDGIKLSKGQLPHHLSICLYYILIRIPEAPIKKLAKSDVRPVMMRCIKQPDRVININGELYAPQTLVLEKDFVISSSLDEEFFLEILQCLCDITDRSGSAPISSKFRDMLSKVDVSGNLILKLIHNNKGFQNVSSVKAARAKRRKIDCNYLNLGPWRKLRFIVELIGIFGSRVKQSWVLIQPLFNHFELSLAELSLGSKKGYAELFHQRLLTTIQLLLQLTEKDLNRDSKEINEKVKINFSLLVQLIRTTDNPDTRRRVMMILSLTMSYFPDKILENVISIFTFMGLSLIKMDDNYSIEVIHQAMDTILPPLIKSVQSNPENLNRKLFQVLKLFIVAFPDIPQHRRMPLYLQLARTIGSDHLWLLMAATAETHVFHSKCSSFHFSKLTSFWDSLFRHFSVIDRLNTIRRVVEFLVDIPENTETLKKAMQVHIKILDAKPYSTHQLHRLKYTCVQMLTAFLYSTRLSNEMNNINQSEAGFEFSRVYHIILNVSIPYLKKIAVLGTTSSDPAELQYWPKFEQKMTELVKVMFELLPPHLLIKVIMNLVWSDDLSVRYRALQIVADKMDPQSDFFSEEHSQDAADFVKFLAESGRKNGIPDDVRQMSMFTLHTALKSFGHHIKPELVQSVLHSSVKILNKDKISSDIKLQTVLVAVEGVAILQNGSVKSLDNIINYILNNLKSILPQIQNKIDPALQVLATCLQRITEVLPHHLGNHISTILHLLCGLLYEFRESKNLDFIYCLETTQHQILMVETNVILDNMKEIYFSILGYNFEYLPIFFSQLCIILAEHEMEALFSNIRSLQKLFSLALQIRSSVKCLVNIETTEKSFFKCISTFIGRTEKTSIFSDLHKKTKKYSSISVNVTFYNLCSYLSSYLGVLFVNYKFADLILDEAVLILGSNNTSDSDEMFTDENCMLVDAALDTLHNIFVHDSIDYMNRGRITTCITPIINQIDNIMGGSEVYKNRISNHLKPCIAKIAVLCTDDDFWRDMNRAILNRIKSDWNGENLIILGTLEVFDGIVDEAGREYVQSQLNDIMICLAEALEISDPEIQSKTKSIFLKLEETLGQSLKSYLGS